MSVPTPPKADVKVMFEGLMALSHNKKEDQCEIGILSTPKAIETCHQLMIRVTKTSPAGASVLFDTALTAALSPQLSLFELDATSPANPGVSFRRHRQGPINRLTSPPPDDDFRWVVDLQSDEFHGKDLTPRLEHFSPVLIVKHGEFYTAELSRSLKRIKGNGAKESFGKIATVIGADIFLDENSEAVLKLGNGSNNVYLSLRKEAETSYEIFIDNLCPEPADPSVTTNLESSDFSLYYDALILPDGQKEHKLVVDDSEGAFPEVDTDENPCSGTFLGDTGTLRS